MDCQECGQEIEGFYNCLFCNRCLNAKLYDELQGDDYVLLRRIRGTNTVTLARGIGGERWTNLTYFGIDPREATIEAVDEFLGRSNGA